MATSQLPQLGANADFDQVKSTMIQWQDYLNWFFRNLDSINVKRLTSGTIIVYDLDGGSGTITLTKDGMVFNNGTIDTFVVDINGNVTMTSALIKSTNSLEKIAIDSSGFHSYDTSGVERITIGTTPAKGAKALITRDSSGSVQGVYTYDTETVDGSSRTGQYITANGSYFLLASDGSIRMQDSSLARGLRIAGTRPELNDGFGWSAIAKVSEVNAKQNAFTGYNGSVSVVTSVDFGGMTTTSSTLNFSNGVLTSVT